MANQANHKVKHIYTWQATVQVAVACLLIALFTVARFDATNSRVVKPITRSSSTKLAPTGNKVKPASPKPQAVVTAPVPARPTATPKIAPAPAKTPVATSTPGTGVHSLNPAPSAPPPSSGTSSTTSNPSTPPPQSYTSLNWAGYLANSGGYTAVSSSWVVPSATGTGSSQSADATWVGIGGVSTNDLIQAGTENTVESNGQVYT